MSLSRIIKNVMGRKLWVDKTKNFWKYGEPKIKEFECFKEMCVSMFKVYSQLDQNFNKMAFMLAL